MELGLRGRVALVTGASRGIGLAIALALAEEGARVALVARSPERLQAAAAQAGGLAVGADLTREEGCQEAVERTQAALGPVEILVNNLGGRAGSSWEDTGVRELESAMASNLYPAARLSQLVLPRMRERGWGRIVVIARSSAGRREERRPTTPPRRPSCPL